MLLGVSVSESRFVRGVKIPTSGIRATARSCGGSFEIQGTMITTKSYAIQQFDGKGSFTLWQRRVKDILVQQGLVKALKGKDGKPEGMKDDMWEELESQCVSTIRLYIADNIINNVMDEDSPSALWDKLEKLYLAKSLTNKLHLKRQLYKLKMDDGDNLMDHMNVFNGCLDQLRKVDVNIEEEDKALLLLTSLPDSYENLVTTMLYGKDTVNLEQVQASLVSHSTQKKANLKDEYESVFVARGGNRGRTFDGRSDTSSRFRSSSGGKGVQCYGCKEFGHIKRNCPRRKDGNGPNNYVGVAEDYGDILTVSEGINTSPCDDWILDSGCTMHVCSRRDYFETFQESKGGSLFMANGVPCKIDGVGMVKIMMHDGVVRHLDDVAYVPKIRRNLISIGRMDSMGCKCSFADGAMEITCDNMVLVKGRKCDGLYCLEGSTVLPNSMGCWKQGAQIGFQDTDNGEGFNPAGGEGASRLSPEVN